MTIHWKAVEEYFSVVLSVFSIMDSALSGLKGTKRENKIANSRFFQGNVPVYTWLKLRNKEHHTKALFNSFLTTGHTSGFNCGSESIQK